MNTTDKYILDAIKKKVWSGFYNPTDVQQLIDDDEEDGLDGRRVRLRPVEGLLIADDQITNRQRDSVDGN